MPHPFSAIKLPRRMGTSPQVARGGNQQHSRAAAERGVVILPGLGNNAGDYAPLATALATRGFTVETAPVVRADWLRNSAGLADRKYWSGNLEPRPTVDWYLNKVQAAVTALRERTEGPTALLTHSAGGWLARVYLRDYGTEGFDRLVSLGSPHTPPPAGVIDQTRGILTFCEATSPGAYHPEIKYVTIAGRYIKGSALRGEGSIAQKVAGAGYQQVCGEAEVWGDGIVPVPSAHLAGALNVNLENVYHSPLGASEERKWYGDDEVLENWVNYLTDDL